jgi:hypothetical protein
MVNLMRNNYLPVLCRDFSQETITRSNILVFNAPTKSFNCDEVAFLKHYMTEGGFIILSTGYTDKPASYPLLTQFNLDIDDVPLGPVPYIENTSEEFQHKPRFVDSWPIRFTENNTRSRSFYNFTIPGWEPAYHLMVFTRYGNGGLLLISDSQYLLDKNLESVYDYWPGNILLVKYIFDEFRALEAST